MELPLPAIPRTVWVLHIQVRDPKGASISMHQYMHLDNTQAQEVTESLVLHIQVRDADITYSRIQVNGSTSAFAHYRDSGDQGPDQGLSVYSWACILRPSSPMNARPRHPAHSSETWYRTDNEWSALPFLTHCTHCTPTICMPSIACCKPSYMQALAEAAVPAP